MLSAKKTIILLFTAIAFTACMPTNTRTAAGKNSAPTQSKKILKSTVSSVQVVNESLIISGTGFSNVDTIEIVMNGTHYPFTVTQLTPNSIIAKAASTLKLLAIGTADLVIGTATAQAVFPVTFSIPDASITSSKLHSMGATAGQILKYNGTAWVPSSVSDVQTYIGTWNANMALPDVTLTRAGDYYVVSTAGNGYAVGDWIVSDGYTWSKIPYSNTSVSSFQGRRGIVTLKPTDYVSLKDTNTNKITSSSINDFADVDLTSVTPVNGSVLKYNGAKWVVGTDNSGATPGSIVDADVSATANIAQSKINGLTAALAAKESTASLAADVLAVPLTGLASATGSIAATDSILGAFGKVLNTQSDYVSKSSGASITTGTINVSGTGMITVPTATGTTLTEVANVTYVTNAIAANGVWAKNTNDISYTAGKVGIGTTTPGYALSVVGDITASSRISINDAFVGTYTFQNSGKTLLRDELTLANGILRNNNYGAYTYLDFSNGDTGWKFYTTNTAKNAGLPRFTIGGAGDTANVSFTNSNVGVGTTTPATALHVAGPATGVADTVSSNILTLSRPPTAPTEGPIAALALGRSDGTNNSRTRLDFVLADVTQTLTGAPTILSMLSSGYVGIGTTSPAGPLDVRSSYLQFTLDSSGSSNAGLTFKETGTHNGTQFYLEDADNLSTRLAFDFRGNGGTGKIIAGTSDGNVGLGTTAPAYKLDIRKTDAAGSYFNGAASSDGGQRGLTFTSSDNGIYLGAIHTLNATSAGGMIAFATGGTERARIDSSGNVGIGTTTPLYKLVVSNSGAEGFEFSPTGGIGSGTFFQSYNRSTSAYLDNTFYGKDFHWWSQTGGSVEVMTLKNGNVGIGTTSPTQKLEINAANDVQALFKATGGANAGGISIDTDAANTGTSVYFKNQGNTKWGLLGYFNGGGFSIYDYTNSTERFRIASNGNVGIGTNAPSYKLQVGDAADGSEARANAWNILSDERLKKNFDNIPDALEKILAINGYYYYWNRGSDHSRKMGVKAQEVQRVFPEVVSKGKDGFLSVSYNHLVAAVIEAVKDLYHQWHDDSKDIHREIASLKEENQKLKKQNEEMNERLKRIEKTLQKK